MPYNEQIDERIQNSVRRWGGIDKRKMFGGTCYLLKGNMLVGVWKDYMILRLGEAQAEVSLKRAYVKEFDITGKPMKGWVMVGKRGFHKDSEFESWLKMAKDFVKTLPQK